MTSSLYRNSRRSGQNRSLLLGCLDNPEPGIAPFEEGLLQSAANVLLSAPISIGEMSTRYDQTLQRVIPNPEEIR